MSNSLQEERWENTTRLLFFKYRGDLVRVLEDLRAKYGSEVGNANERITLGFVKKVIDRFKRQQKINDPFVATWIMEYIFMGTKQREVDWQIDDQELEEFKFLYRSVCCDKATERRRDNDTGEEFFVCLSCSNRCQVYRIPNLDIFEVKRRIRTEKRKDEEQLVKAMDTLGFTGEKAPVIRQTNYQFIAGETEVGRSRKKVESLPVEDQKLLKDLDTMGPRDRETVRKQLERIRRDVVEEG
jgi:hypothetical protein